MSFLASAPVDRYSAAHEHFGSAGLDTQKLILIGVAVVVVAFFVIYAMKK